MATAVMYAVMAAAGPTVTPDAGGLPGSAVLERLAGGLEFWALLAAIAGMVISGVVWALGSQGQNYVYSSRGRAGTVTCALAALLVGAASAIVSFFFNVGLTVR